MSDVLVCMDSLFPDSSFRPLASPLSYSLAAVVAVDVESGRVRRITPANGASWSLLASEGGERRSGGARRCIAG